ncbi:MAG: DUF421 domain-containing protein [Clostridia bacterium]|nr:DUF421 domain-containing protein [Clostridia bacterium]
MSETLVVIVRAVIGFFTLLIYTRVLGKQQISQLTYFDYILGITIGSIAAALTTDLTVTAWPHWVGLTVWTTAGLAMQWVTLKWRFASKYMDGEPTVVIMNGKIMEGAMRKARYRASDLMEQLRVKDTFDLGEVEFAILETNGTLSVLKKSQFHPVTRSDMNLPSQYQGISTELVYNGVVVDQNLEQVHLDRAWLATELRRKGVSDASEVFLATLDTSGSLYVDTFRDHVASPVDTGDFPGPY